MKRYARLLFVLAATLLCASCAGGFRSDARAPQAYVLRVKAASTDALPNSPTLQIARPQAHPGLAGDRIMLLRSDRRLDHFNGVRWADELPDVVEALVVDSLRTSGAFGTVQDSAATFSSDYLLRITIRRFEAVYSGEGGSPRVHVAFDCTLGRRSDRQVLASFAAEGVADSSANRVSAVVTAFEGAATTAVHAMAERIVATLIEARPARAAER